MQNWASRHTFISTRQRLNHDTQGWDEHCTAADFQTTGDLLNKIFNRHRRQPHAPMERVSKRRRGLTLCHCITCKVKLGHPNQTILFLTGGEFQPHFIRRRFCCVPGFLIWFQPIFHTGHVRTNKSGYKMLRKWQRNRQPVATLGGWNRDQKVTWTSWQSSQLCIVIRLVLPCKTNHFSTRCGNK